MTSKIAVIMRNQLVIFFCLFVIMVKASAQDKVFNDTHKITKYSNEFILEGKEGRLIVISSNRSIDYAVIFWSSGYFAIGTFQENKAVGKWIVYDRKSREREYLTFGPEAKCILYSKKIYRRGKIISEFKAQTPCF